MRVEDFESTTRPILERSNSGKYYFQVEDEKTKVKYDLCLLFNHNIFKNWWKTEFTYSVEIRINDASGPLFPLDQINMEITREIDQSNYVISSYNSAQCYHIKAFRPGPSGTSCLTPVIIHQGVEYRYVIMCQSAN